MGDDGDDGDSRVRMSSFGKYGLESVRLLVRLWPRGTEYPQSLLDIMPAVHREVLEILLLTRRGDVVVERSSSSHLLGCPSSSMLIGCLPPTIVKRGGHNFPPEEISYGVPFSFLEDLRDNGYVKDY